METPMAQRFIIFESSTSSYSKFIRLQAHQWNIIKKDPPTKLPKGTLHKSPAKAPLPEPPAETQQHSEAAEFQPAGEPRRQATPAAEGPGRCSHGAGGGQRPVEVLETWEFDGYKMLLTWIKMV